MSDEQKCPECSGFRNLPRILHDQETPHECSHEFHRLPEVIKFPKIPDTAPEAAQAQELTPPPVQVPNPVCPYCGADPHNLKARTLKMGPYELLIVRCANDECRKTIGVFPVGYDGPMPGRAGGFIQ